MTLSRRDEFAARIAQHTYDPNKLIMVREIVEATDALIAELDRTAPKEAAPEVVDDWREIRCRDGGPVVVDPAHGVVFVYAEADLTPDNADLLALRLQKAAAEARKYETQS